MAKKKGAGGNPQEYDKESGRYGSGDGSKEYRQNTSYAKILTADKPKKCTGHHSGIIPKEKQIDFICLELNVSIEEAKKYVEAIFYYTDKFYHVKAIREYQQGKNIHNKDQVAKQEQALEQYIEKAPKWNGGETFRGVKLTDDDLKRYTIGSERDMLGTSSWSSSEDVAKEFSDDGPFSERKRVIFHSNTQKNGTSVRHLSPLAYEDEVLVSKRSKYRVTKIEKDSGIYHIYMEEI